MIPGFRQSAKKFDKPRRPLRQLLLGVIALQVVAYLLYVFFNWVEYNTLGNDPLDGGTQRYAEQVGGYAFRVYCLCWCTGILLTSGVYLYVRKRGTAELRDAASRDVIGYFFFPVFVAVVAYLPVYLGIEAVMGIIEQVFN